MDSDDDVAGRVYAGGVQEEAQRQVAEIASSGRVLSLTLREVGQHGDEEATSYIDVVPLDGPRLTLAVTPFGFRLRISSEKEAVFEDLHTALMNVSQQYQSKFFADIAKMLTRE